MLKSLVLVILLLVFIAVTYISPSSAQTIPPETAESSFCAKQNSDTLIFCQDFEQSTPGLVTSESFDKDWSNIKKLSNIFNIKYFGIKEKRITISSLIVKKNTESDKSLNKNLDKKPNKNKDKNHSLEVLYPKGKYGPINSGATWIIKFPQNQGPYEQLNLEYKVMFGEGFIFDQKGLVGGKLPGLMGGKSISGNANANGKNGWTARMMWGQQGRGLAYI